MDWVIIADDLTGACDTGACFARHGFLTLAALNLGAWVDDAGVMVCCTETRYLQEDAAVRVVRNVVENRIHQGKRPLIFKKIDSTLRGHPGAELRAVLETLCENRAVVTPAFPTQGRVVRSGRLWVHNQPLEETVFYPEVTTGSLVHWFDFPPGYRPIDRHVLSISQDLERTLEHDTGIFGLDVETDDDLDTIAAAGLAAGIRVWCGSAGLARSLARATGSGERFELERLPAAWLVVAGSQHPTTLSQVEALEQAGAVVVSLDQSMMIQGTGQGNLEDFLIRIASHVVRELDLGKMVVLSVRGLTQLPGYQKIVASALGAVVRWTLKTVSKPPAGLVLTGGDTAAAVCGALGCGLLRLDNEIEPGLALSRMADGQAAGLRVITKAGGFGQTGTLLRLFRR